MDTESRKVYRSKVGHERDLAPDIAGGNDVVSVLSKYFFLDTCIGSDT